MSIADCYLHLPVISADAVVEATSVVVSAADSHLGYNFFWKKCRNFIYFGERGRPFGRTRDRRPRSIVDCYLHLPVISADVVVIALSVVVSVAGSPLSYIS